MHPAGASCADCQHEVWDIVPACPMFRVDFMVLQNQHAVKRMHLRPSSLKLLKYLVDRDCFSIVPTFGELLDY